MLRFAAIAIPFSLLACSASTTGPTTGAPGADASVDTAVTPPADTAVTPPADTGPASCKTNVDCSASTEGKTCELATGKCVQCTKANDTCPASEHCDANKCVAGCKSNDGCTAAGKTRCDVPKNTCVECLGDTDCAAGFVCSGNVCSMGCSDSKLCPGGQACCTGACVDVMSNSDNCGGCGTKCSITGGTAKCETGKCAVATCTGLTADCDRNFTNACETDTSSTVSNCGGCGTTCPFVVNGLPACTGGKCDAACDMGFGNCDSDLTNGCESNLLSNRNNCGACGTVCPSTLVNGTPVCASGKCSAVCNAGYGDCDKNLTTGCETAISTDPKNCGGCGIECAALANATATCGTGACVISSCNPNYGNCDGVIANGCEANLPNDPNNCGTCGRVCTLPNATNGCSAGACTIAACTGAFKNCNGTTGDGCEINTDTDRNNCGACGTVCPTGDSCVAGVCKFAPAVTYNDSFTVGVASTSAQCTRWNNFRAAINATTVYSKVTIRGSNQPSGVSCTGPTANTLCQAVRAGTPTSAIACDGRSWKVGGCTTATSIELSANGDTCACSTGYIARPCILHQDWGGVNSITCRAPTQTLEVSCE